MKFCARILLITMAFLASRLMADPALMVFSGNANALPDAGTLAANISVGPLEEGTGLDTFIIDSKGYNASDWTEGEMPVTSSSFKFTITPDAGYNLHLTRVSFNYKIQGNGPDKVALGYDAIILDNSHSPILGPPTETNEAYNVRNAEENYNNASLNATLYGGTTYTMYLMGYSSNQPNRSATIDDLTVYGTVTAVPEPTTAAMLFGAVAMAGVMIRRRRARGKV